MPHRAKRICQRPGCGAVCDLKYCAKCAPAERGRFDKLRGSAASRGYGRTWEKLRGMILARDPLCQLWKLILKHEPKSRVALECGGMTPSTDVHHIVPKSSGGDNSEDNLLGGCHNCHSYITAMTGRGVKFL